MLSVNYTLIFITFCLWAKFMSQTAAQALLFECDFESSDLCGFKQVETDDSDWIQDCCGTPSTDTGPSSAFEGSYYVYVEASGGSNGDVAMMISPQVDAPTFCSELRFAYHMYGSDMGDLNVYVTDMGADMSQVEPHITISGNRGSQWYTYTTNITKHSYQVAFEAIKGSGFKSDVAIDDITIKPCKDILFECSFESDPCDFVQDDSDDAQWTRDCCGTPSPDTGPSSAFEGMYYMYFETSVGSLDDVTRLTTPESISQSNCSELSFAYHMYGSTMGVLNVYVISTDSTNFGLVMNQFSVGGDQGNQWYVHIIDIFSDLPYKVVFEAIRGNDFRSDIAIDNVIIKGDSTTGTGTTALSTTTLSTTSKPTFSTTTTNKPATSASQSLPPTTREKSPTTANKRTTSASSSLPTTTAEETSMVTTSFPTTVKPTTSASSSLPTTTAEETSMVTTSFTTTVKPTTSASSSLPTTTAEETSMVTTTSFTTTKPTTSASLSLPTTIAEETSTVTTSFTTTGIHMLFVVGPSDIAVSEGSNATLTCTVTNLDLSSQESVLWSIKTKDSGSWNQLFIIYYTGSEIQIIPLPQPVAKYEIEELEGGQYNLVVYNVSSADTAMYACSIGDPTDNAQLTILVHLSSDINYTVEVVVGTVMAVIVLAVAVTSFGAYLYCRHKIKTRRNVPSQQINPVYEEPHFNETMEMWNSYRPNKQIDPVYEEPQFKETMEMQNSYRPNNKMLSFGMFIDVQQSSPIYQDLSEITIEPERPYQALEHNQSNYQDLCENTKEPEKPYQLLEQKPRKKIDL